MSGFMVRLLGTALLAAAIPASASADIFFFDFVLDESQEVPPTGSPGVGHAHVTYDSDTNELVWDIFVEGLLGEFTGAHFHGPADFGQNAPVQVDISGSWMPKDPMNGFLIGSAAITENQEADLLAGLWYVNVHSTQFPAGEIRGQVIPAPLGLAVFAGALLTGATRSRRRKA